jgi:methylmalonyl-CoA mutase C-terminal domain/subunit
MCCPCLNEIIQIDEFLFATVLGEDTGADQSPRYDVDSCPHLADMERTRKLRVLVAKPGSDGHDLDVRSVAVAFCDAGFEVIYTGCHQTPEQIVSTAIQEDVDLIWLSIISVAQNYSLSRVLGLLREKKAEDILVICEGPFPFGDSARLKRIGTKEVFGPDAKPVRIANWVSNNIRPRKELCL